MGRKRKLCEPATTSIRKSARFAQNNEVQRMENPPTESLKRCRDWIIDQRADENDSEKETKTIFESEIKEEVAESPIAAVDSLAILKKIKKSSFKLKVLFACEWRGCRKEFGTEEELHDHVGEHILNAKSHKGKYCCCWDLCYFETTSNEETSRHIFYHAYHTILKTYGEGLVRTVMFPECTNDSRNRNMIPNLKKDFFCQWVDCEKYFKSIFLFLRHVRAHCVLEFQMLKPTVRYDVKQVACQWANCDKKFARCYRLQEHMKKHSNEKLIGCHHCGTLFCSNTKLYDHCKRQLANNTQEFQCAQCFKYFSSERILRTHILVHVNCYKCTLCDMTCSLPSTLTKHIRFKHLRDKPFKCMSCDYACVLKEDLREHIFRKHQKKTYECPELDCEFVGKSMYAVQKHGIEMHDIETKVYACHCCDKFFDKGRNLSVHLVESHNFQLPSGHSRFTYRMDEDGCYRLQTMRIESLEVTKQILSPNVSRPEPPLDDEKLDANDIKELELLYDAIKAKDESKDSATNNILVTILDVDEAGNVLNTVISDASEIKF